MNKLFLFSSTIYILSVTKVSHPSILWVFQPNCFVNTHGREPLTLA